MQSVRARLATSNYAQPVFRTSLRLRFAGEGIRGHDLAGVTAAGVLSGITGSLGALATQLQLPPGSTEMFLSPTVSAGSAVLELFGPEVVNREERLDVEIDDAPIDHAIEAFFSILSEANLASAKASAISPIPGQLGKQLFTLSKNLIDANVDLDLAWSRPRGRTETESMSRTTARALRAALDVETVESAERRATGTLSSISTSGSIGFVPDGLKGAITIDASEFDPEALRVLWAAQVDATWTETTKSHPQREQRSTTRALSEIRLADNTPDTSDEALDLSTDDDGGGSGEHRGGNYR